ncbi:MAG: exodeoxyribonuclease VII small subunit [Chloroflexi bacterium]|nr:exodeoxyribonuclease VII small subunit [Chloroflexota bacterium]
MPDATDPAQMNSAQPKTFEESFSRLEETVRALEAGKLSLDDATRLFEQGMALAKRCNELLSAAELKVTRLQTAFAEQMRFLQDNGAGLEEEAETPEPGA